MSALLRLFNVQGVAGLAASLALLGLLLVQKGETRHWRKQSTQFEQLYRAEQAAASATVANVRAASAEARAADLAAAQRVRAQQESISERIEHEFQARLADARARADRLRAQGSGAAADPRVGRAAAVPGLPAPSVGAPEAADQDRLPAPDALIATEQAIQLDALIAWVRAQQKVDANGAPAR
jgi:hypothetical protein